MKHILKIKGGEYEVPHVIYREKDPFNGKRNTVTIITDLEYAAVVALFSDPGEWSHTMQHEPRMDTEGNVVSQQPDIVKDCTDYDTLLSIKDNRDGVLEIVMSKITAEEALAELREALEG